MCVWAYKSVGLHVYVYKCMHCLVLFADMYSCTRTAAMRRYVLLNCRCMHICFYACVFSCVTVHALIPLTAMLTLRPVPPLHPLHIPILRSVWAASGSALPAAAPCQPPWGQHLPPGHVWGEKPPLAVQGKPRKSVVAWGGSVEMFFRLLFISFGF